MATFACSSCGYTKDVPDKLAGRKAKCPECHAAVTIGQEPVADDVAENVETARFYCVSCDYSRDVPAKLKGQKAKCPKCGQAVIIGREEREALDVDLGSIPEENLDLTDLVEEEEPQVWDKTYEGGEDVASTDLSAYMEDRGRASFAQGGVAKNVFSGLVTGSLSVLFCLAFAGLVFPRGVLEQLQGHGFAMALVATIVGGALYALRSNFPSGQAGAEAVGVALMSIQAGAVVSRMPQGASEQTVVATVLATLIAMVLLFGLTLFLLGRFRVGSWIRFVPIQIVGGVLGGVGLMVLVRGYEYLSGGMLTWGEGLALLSAPALERAVSGGAWMAWAPAAVFGLILFIVLRGRGRSLLMLLLCLALGAAGASVLWFPDTPIAHAVLSGGFVPEYGGWREYAAVFTPELFHQVDWNAMREQQVLMGALVVLGVFATMHKITKLEAGSGGEADLDTEFKSLGFENILTAGLAGMAVSVSQSRTTGAQALGAGGALAGLTSALVCAAAFALAGPWLFYVPKLVPAGLIFFFGLSLLRTWLTGVRTAFTRRDDLSLMVVAFLATVVMGVVVGTGLGVALAMMVLIHRHSRGGAVKHALSGATHRSSVDRVPSQLAVLRTAGDRIFVVQLQGFLFLGSMHSVFKQINDRMADWEREPLQYVIIDFSRVTGLGSSMGLGFERLWRLMQDKSIEIVLTSAPFGLEEHLEKSGYSIGEDRGSFKMFMDLDFAMEWAEDFILDDEDQLAIVDRTLPELLQPVFPDAKYIPALMKCLERVELKKNQYVFHQGDVSDAMYFIETGSVNIELELEGGKLLRLKKMAPGNVLGEMGIYNSAPRSASARVPEKTVLYRLTLIQLRRVQQKAPALGQAINRYLVNLLAARIADANIKIRDLMT